jgi:hypothetical protein
MMVGTSPSGTPAFSLRVKMLLPKRGPKGDMPSILRLACDKQRVTAARPRAKAVYADVRHPLSVITRYMHKGTREQHGSHR